MAQSAEFKKANASLRAALEPGLGEINAISYPATVMSALEQRPALEAIKAGADPDLKMTRGGPAAICCAVAMGADLVVRALIERGADFEQRVKPYKDRSPTGYTALGVAAEKRLGGIAADLCRAGADPMAPMPTFSERSERDAPVVWTLIFSGLEEAIGAGAAKIDWEAKVQGPGLGSGRGATVTLMTLAAVLSRNALRGLVVAGMQMPKNFQKELESIGYHGDRMDGIMEFFSEAEREALGAWSEGTAKASAPRRAVL